MQTTLLPRVISDQIDRALRNFLWGDTASQNYIRLILSPIRYLIQGPLIFSTKKKFKVPLKQHEIDLTVAAVITENNHWDLCYISMQLPTEIATFIQAIPLSYTQSNSVQDQQINMEAPFRNMFSKISLPFITKIEH